MTCFEKVLGIINDNCRFMSLDVKLIDDSTKLNKGFEDIIPIANVQAGGKF